MVRKTKKQVYVEEEVATVMPTYGAGSVYNYERKEEARKKRRGYIKKEVNPDDLPYALRLDGKGGKRYLYIYFIYTRFLSANDALQCLVHRKWHRTPRPWSDFFL